MKQLKDLWRRAFLWRLTIYAFVICLTLAIIFPATWMERDLPWRSAKVKSGHHDSASPQAQHLPESTEELASVSGSIPFAGHRIPLPAGIWHPIIAANGGIQGSQEVLSLVRIDQNIVSGVIMLGADTHSLTRAGLDSEFNLCDGTGNYISQSVKVTDADGTLECWYLAPSKTSHRTETQDFPRVIGDQLDRLGVPYPALFVQARWVFAAPGTPGTWYPIVISFYLAPNEAGSLRLIAPLSSWNVRDFAADRIVRSFIGRTESWFDNWIAILRSAMKNGMTGPRIPIQKQDKDPAYPL